MFVALLTLQCKSLFLSNAILPDVQKSGCSMREQPGSLG